MKNLNFLITSVAFLQWIFLPLLVRGTQNLVEHVVGRYILLLDVIVAILVIACALLGPLSLLGLLPLGSLLSDYNLAAIVGGILSIPLTRFVRAWSLTSPYFR
jgi:hypothetical protein